MATAAADVFISYAREDRELAQALAQALGAQGLSAWWDREIPLGRDFAEVIGEQLSSARVSCVLWSPDAVQSSFVRDEAGRARDAGKLLPIRIADVALPLGFGTLQTLDLIGWDGNADDEACEVVVKEIHRAVANSHDRAQAGPAAAPSANRLVSSAYAGRRPARRTQLVAWLGLAGLLCVGLGWGGVNVYQAREARFHLGEGLKAQFARDPNLEVARTEYLYALAADQRLASAHYYLGHVYAQIDEPADAREQFLAALQIGEGLDGDQRREAEKLLRTLTDDEPTALASASPLDAKTGGPPGSTEPTPAPPPSERPGPGATAGAAKPVTAAPTPTLVPVVAQRDVAQLADLAQRVPAQPDFTRDVGRHVDALFGTDAQARLNAATAMALAPAENSEALPLAVARALAGLARAPADAAVRSGVNATLVLLQNASAISLAFGRSEIERLLDAAAPLSPELKAGADKVRARLASAGQRAPLVYLQIADAAQRPLAQAMARRFSEAGYEVPGIELVSAARAPARSEIRAQGTSNLGLGRWQRRQVQEVTGGAAAALVVLRKASPAVDTYEIWLDKDLCVAPDRKVAGCAGG
jgi:hypothetical protein